jgi:hypothetical protein
MEKETVMFQVTILMYVDSILKYKIISLLCLARFGFIFSKLRSDTVGLHLTVVHAVSENLPLYQALLKYCYNCYGKGYVFPFQATKAYTWCNSIAPLIGNLGNRCR